MVSEKPTQSLPLIDLDAKLRGTKEPSMPVDKPVIVSAAATVASKLTLLDDRIAVEVMSSDVKSKGGIYIPHTAKKPTLKGKVHAVGAGRRNAQGGRDALTIKVGDVILVNAHSGHEITVDGTAILIVQEHEVITKITE